MSRTLFSRSTLSLKGYQYSRCMLSIFFPFDRLLSVVICCPAFNGDGDVILNLNLTTMPKSEGLRSTCRAHRQMPERRAPIRLKRKQRIGAVFCRNGPISCRHIDSPIMRSSSHVPKRFLFLPCDSTSWCHEDDPFKAFRRTIPLLFVFARETISQSRRCASCQLGPTITDPKAIDSAMRLAGTI